MECWIERGKVEVQCSEVKSSQVGATRKPKRDEMMTSEGRLWTFGVKQGLDLGPTDSTTNSDLSFVVHAIMH